VGSHGLAEGGGEHSDARYTVTGVLAPTGTVLDRLVVTSVASVWRVHEHHPDEPAELNPGREVTLALVKYRTPLAASSLPRAINKETELVAASPAYETARLLTVFGAGVDLIRAFALLLVAASTLMLFVALAQALDERRYDLAIMRALGASRAQVATVLLTESLVLAAAGTILGLVIAHVAAAAIGLWLPQAAPLASSARQFMPEEWAVVALAMAAGIIAAMWPAWRAYRLMSRPRLPKADAMVRIVAVAVLAVFSRAGRRAQHHIPGTGLPSARITRPGCFPTAGVVSWKTLAQVEPIKKDGKMIPGFSREIWDSTAPT
jgi:putative ABC transport system permease protein